MKAINKNQVRVNTSEYRFSHSREPKGGRCWAFTFGMRDAKTMDDYKWFDGTYAQAKKQAVAAAADLGISEIFVQP